MREMSSMSIEKFRAIADSLHGMPTDRIVEILDRKHFWDDEVLEQVQMAYKKNFVRQMLGRIVRDDGQRLFVNLTVEDSRGRRTRVYKNRERMTVEEFRQAVEYYRRLGLKGLSTAKSLARDCKAIHGVQLRFNYADHN